MKKSILVVTMILLLSLLATSTVSAAKDPRLPTWEQVFDPVANIGEGAGTDSGVEFKGNLYFKFWGAETGDQVWGTKDGKNWWLAWEANDIQEGYEGISYFSVFKNLLYAGVVDWDEELPGLLMRTPDGKHWEVVATWPLDDIGVFGGGFTSFQGWLYLGSCGFVTEEDSVCGLWRSISGDAGTWELVVLFPGWNDITSFAAFKGALYVGSLFVIDEDWNFEPAQIWRSYDGVNWEPVTTDGFGDPANIVTWSFGQKDSYLYIGTGGFEGSGDIWRSKDGMNWQPVTTDGLGNPNNVAFGFVTYQNLLYAYSVNNEEGCIVYASKDGLHYTPVNEPGWGDPANNAVWQDDARVIFKGALYMGSYGPGGVYGLSPDLKSVK